MKKYFKKITIAFAIITAFATAFLAGCSFNSSDSTPKQDNTCTISISCASVLSRIDELDPDTADIIPADGWILKPETVAFNEGDSAFDILNRVCKEKSIHMEFSQTPIYNSAYVEGISNLYEFDCGSLSGWMYCVNDLFPNYGCSRYSVKDGDNLKFLYTCDLGKDIGGDYASGEQYE